MSLSVEPKPIEGGRIVAYVYRNNKRTTPIQYIPESKVSGRVLRRIILSSPNEALFPSITHFDAESPRDRQVDRIYITGETGCGKSTYICNYCIAYHKQYPKARIFLFSGKTEDPVLDDLGYVERLAVDPAAGTGHEFYNVDWFAEQSSPSLVIFDDVQDSPIKGAVKEWAKIRDEIMRNGRSKGIFSVFVNHNPCDYHATRNQIFEANKIVTFPRQCGKGAYDRLYVDKLKLNQEIMAYIKSNKSGYVVINKTLPRTIVSDRYVLLDME